MEPGKKLTVILVLSLSLAVSLGMASAQTYDGSSISSKIQDVPAPDNRTEPASDAVAQYKFDGGFYQKIQDLILEESSRTGLQGSPQKIQNLTEGPQGASGEERRYNVIIVVGRNGSNPDDTARQNKDSMVRHLNSLGARDIVAAESLSFVTASVPVSQIPGLSLREEILQMGDGELPVTAEVDTARRTIRATPSTLDYYIRWVPDGTGVVVAVVDTGINSAYLNDRVVDRICSECSVRGRSNTDPPYYSPAISSHGTRVAQVIAASGMRSNNGMAPGVTLLDAMYGQGGGSYSFFSGLLHAVDWAYSRGADVVNISAGHRGISCSENSAASYSMIVNEAVDRGMVVVKSAGNKGYPDGSPEYQSISPPGCAHNVIAVGGINDRGSGLTMYTSSSRGPISHFEPRLAPHIVAPAARIQILEYPDYDYTSPRSGTSVAAPQVSAAAAMLLQARPDLTPAGVRAALLLGARWTGPVPCTSAQYEWYDPGNPCSYATQPADYHTANNAASLEILNNVGFGVLDVVSSLWYAGHRAPYIISDHLDDTTWTRTYGLDVTDASRPVKVILTWMVDPVAPQTDLDFEITTPGGLTMYAYSAHQTTEFVVFNPPETGLYTINVHGYDLYTPSQTFALASNSRLTDPPPPDYLHVSAERSATDNSFGGPMVVEILVNDPDLGETDEAEGQPDVTVNGEEIMMVQADSGSWYAYIAHLDVATAADNTAFDFGTLNCNLGSINSPVAVDGYFCNEPTQNVVREPEALSTTFTVNGIGQVNLPNRNIWPVIQLFDFADEGDIDIVYNKGGSTQLIELTYTTSMDDYSTAVMDRESYTQNADVHLTIDDMILNIDPTDEDSWTFDTATGDAYYQVFDENGVLQAGPITSKTVARDSLEFGDAATLLIDPNPNTAADNLQFVGNGYQDLGALDTAVSQPVTVVETWFNTGVFENTDEYRMANIMTAADAVRETTATIDYNDSAVSLPIAFDYGNVTMTTGDDAWDSGEILYVTIDDDDMNRNSWAYDDFAVSDPQYIIPAMRIGSPSTLASTPLDVTMNTAAGTVTLGPSHGVWWNGTQVTAEVTGFSDILKIKPEQLDDTGADTADGLSPAAGLGGIVVHTDHGVPARIPEGIFYYLNYDIRSLGDDAVIEGMTTATDGPQGLKRISAESGDIAPASITGTYVISGITGTMDQNGQQSIHLGHEYPIVIDIFVFGQNETGRYNNAIYRLEPEEIGLNSGYFEGTMEYAVPNQINALEESTYSGINPTGRNLAVIINGDHAGDDPLRLDYLDVGADGVAAQVADTISVITNRATSAPDILINAAISSASVIEPDVADPDGDDITITVLTEPALGHIDDSSLSSGIIIYTPNQTGIERIDYAASDSRRGGETGTITIFINEAGNARPELATIHNTGARVGVDLSFIASATDDDDASLTFGIANVPDGATMDPATGEFEWMPQSSQNGGHTVTVFVHDDSGGADWQDVVITALRADEINLPPAPEDVTTDAVIGELKSIRPGITDPENDDATIISVSESALGSVTDAFLSRGIIVYLGGELGSEDITYTVSDGRGGITNATISITVVEPANVNPILDFVGDKVVIAGTSLSFEATAIDIDGFVSGFELDGVAPAGASISPFGTFNWMPTGDQVGRHDLTIIVFDDAGGNDTETISVTVRPEGHVNSAPTAPDVVIATSQGIPNIARPVMIDPDGDPVVISETGPTTKGQILSGFLRAGIIIYQPGPGQTGTETTSYTAFDGSNGMDTATITIFINENGNGLPVLESIDHRNINVGQTLTFDVTATDPDGDALSYLLVGAPGNAGISAQGGFSWTPAAADEGNHTITIVAYDERGGSDAQVASIRVLPAGTPNSPPNAPSTAITVEAGASIVISPEISDPDGDSVSITYATSNGDGVIISSDETIDYIHVSTAPTETITYTVTDIRGASSTGTITVTIMSEPVPDGCDGSDDSINLDIETFDVEPGWYWWWTICSAGTINYSFSTDNEYDGYLIYVLPPETDVEDFVDYDLGHYYDCDEYGVHWHSLTSSCNVAYGSNIVLYNDGDDTIRIYGRIWE